MVEKPSKIIRKISKQRKKEFLPEQAPSQPYVRQFRKTRMSWPIALIYMGRKDILVLVLVVLGFFTAGALFMLYHVYLWLSSLF